MRRLLIATSVAALVLIPLTDALAHHRGGHNPPGHRNRVERGDRPDRGDNRHPSGKDRSVEPGSAGASRSDPDDDGRGPDRSNGGPDKPGGSGGIDQGDQDFNNGCGNDDDFEDDNEGLCLGHAEEEPDLAVAGAGGPAPRRATASGPAPDRSVRSTSPDSRASDNSHSSHNSHERGGVLSAVAGRFGDVVLPAVLPMTGAQVLHLVLAGLGLAGLGTLFIRFARRRTA